MTNKEEELNKLQKKKNLQVNWQIEAMLNISNLNYCYLFLVAMDRELSMNSIDIYEPMIIKRKYDFPQFSTMIISSYFAKILKPWFKKNFDMTLTTEESDIIKDKLFKTSHENSQQTDIQLNYDALKTKAVSLPKFEQHCYKIYSKDDFKYSLFTI